MSDRYHIVLCMIVRNEAVNLPRCLESIRGVADEIIVVDTGSTDASMAVAQSYGARVLSYDWQDDFALARLQDGSDDPSGSVRRSPQVWVVADEQAADATATEATAAEATAAEATAAEATAAEATP